MRFQTKNGVLIAQANGETLRIEPWGKDSLRVRAMRVKAENRMLTDGIYLRNIF